MPEFILGEWRSKEISSERRYSRIVANPDHLVRWRPFLIRYVLHMYARSLVAL